MNNENIIPKWQRELKSFLGIKSGIVLEGNVYDEYPIFDCSGDEPVFACTDNLDQAILSLIDNKSTDVFFFDPISGFYCYGENTDMQKELLEPLFDGYCHEEVSKNQGTTICYMPSDKKGAKNNNRSSEKFIWVSEIIRRAMLDSEGFTKKENIVFVLNFASRLDACNLSGAEANTMYLNILAATTSSQAASVYSNSLICIVDKYNDIPTWVYLNNPNVRNIAAGVPDRSIRRMYLENLWDRLEIYKVLSEEDNKAGKQFIAETEGMKLQEIHQILRLALKMNINPEDINLAFRLFKYGVLENPWENLENDILVHIADNLNKRVKGQDAAIEKVKTVATRAVKGLSGLQHSGASHKPKGILFFAGPTGVGKTETAKALAESIFGDENACIRFDMSEYRLPESDQKLFGAPPGYVGYEGGGQLTNAVKNRPFSVLLFDEIEKASPTILDKFLQILEDGRMTDNQGNTVYFGETIIIFTSNIGLTKEVYDPSTMLMGSRPHREPTITIENPMEEDTPEFRDKVTELLTEGVKSYFTDNGRPELLNRLGEDNIVVFQFINKPDAMVICDYKLDSICKNIELEKDIKINVEDIREHLREKAVTVRANGGRGVGNMLEKEFLNELSNYLCTLAEKPNALTCKVVEDKIVFEVV